MNWKKYVLEFISIFVAVILAFTLNNWNENKKDRIAERGILQEISLGLEKDLQDTRLNIYGHEQGLKACNFWRDIVNNNLVKLDSLENNYMRLTRDFISIQNTSGYESLKSRGLEIIEDEELRSKIISLYEYHYNILLKFEEDYDEMQYQKNYFHRINDLLVDALVFGADGSIQSITTPLNLSKKDRNTFLSYLWKIEKNRNFVLDYSRDLERNISALNKEIKAYLKKT